MFKAIDLALELGMNERSFCFAYGKQDPMEEESLRRTWWEIYVMDGFTAALHRKPKFRTNSILADVLLPCEESVYAEGGACLPESFSVAQFDNRLFMEEETQFSSFCYRIEAVRILGRVMAIAGMQDIHRDQVQAVDNAVGK